MVKQEPVSLRWQTLFVFIPVVSLWALWRIQKLRKALLIFIPTNLISSGFSNMFERMNNSHTDGFDSFYPDIIGLTILGIGIGITVYFTRKWSKEWNKKLDYRHSDSDKILDKQT